MAKPAAKDSEVIFAVTKLFVKSEVADHENHNMFVLKSNLVFLIFLLMNNKLCS